MGEISTMAKQKSPVLSIGLIVKDEIRTIERCLRALSPLRKAIACELVIADTGSSDGTREIAAEYADILFDFEWINDFSAARNAVIDRCSGTWCLMVDADEILDENIEDLYTFLKGDSQRKFEIVNIIVRNYNSREMKENDCTDFEALRLFRLNRGFRYKGSIHEAIPLSKENVSGRLPSVILHHDGYAQRTQEEKKHHKEKCDRNQQLLEQKLADGGENDPILYVQLIESTHDMKSRKHYCELGYRYLQSKKDKTLNTAEKTLTCRIIACWFLWQEERVFPLLQSVLSQIDTHFLYLCDISFFASRYYEGKKEYEKALFYCRQYEKAIQMYDMGEYEASSFIISSSSCIYLKERLGQQLLLARCLFETGEEKSVKKHLQNLPLSSLFQYEHLFQYYICLLLTMGAAPWVPEQAAVLFAALDMCEEENSKKSAYDLVIQLLTNELAKGTEMDSLRIFETAMGEVRLSVQIMRATEAVQIQTLIEQVEDWQKLSPLAAYHALECRCPLPDSFYEQGIDNLQKMSIFFAMQSNTADILLSWAGALQGEKSLLQVRFVLDYCALVLQKEGHTTDEWNALCRLFVRMADLLSTRMYHPDFLQTKSEWGVLPSVQQFALLLLSGKKALEENEELTFVKLLQEGVRAVPQMKHFIMHLSDKKNRLAAFPAAEMVELAAQVKVLLAQFAPQDPSVRQLKEGEAYKKVAPLVESKYTV